MTPSASGGRRTFAALPPCMSARGPVTAFDRPFWLGHDRTRPET